MRKILSYIEFPQVSDGNLSIDQLQLYSNIHWLLKPLRTLSFKKNWNIQKWFEKKYKPEDFSKYDVIILSDNILITDSIFNRLVKDIENNAKKDAILIVFWINIAHDIERFKLSNRWRVGTFDKSDALKYNFRYYGLYYLYGHVNPIKEEHFIDSELFFIGLDKGRFAHLRRIESLLKPLGIRTNFKYVDSFRCLYNHNYCKPLNYTKVIDNLISSNCILDYYQEGQRGFTQRLYEAIFFNKKLITNNEDITKLDLYNENNILYIKNDDVSRIIDFLEKPFVPYKNEQRLRYQFGSWLDRVLSDTECDDI